MLRRKRNIFNFLQNWVKFNKDTGVYFDITSFSCHAKNIDILKWGYNRDKEALPQINLGLILGIKSQLPISYEIYPGFN